MPYVSETEEAQADAHLKEVYRNIEKNFGFIPHYFKALGAMPKAIDGQLQLSAAVMGVRQIHNPRPTTIIITVMTALAETYQRRDISSERARMYARASLSIC